jgi:hypothetical protein
MRISFTTSAIDALREMAPERLLYYATSRMVYLKVGMHNGERAFVIYDADGTPLEAVNAIEDVWERIAEKGLSLATVH